MKEFIFLIGFLPEIRANYVETMEKKIFKMQFCLLCVSLHVSIFVKVAHSRKAVDCYIVVLVAIRSGVSSAKCKRIDSIVVMYGF
jgi:hypothetical protein